MTNVSTSSTWHKGLADAQGPFHFSFFQLAGFAAVTFVI
jgi:hypothetical protein